MPFDNERKEEDPKDTKLEEKPKRSAWFTPTKEEVLDVKNPEGYFLRNSRMRHGGFDLKLPKGQTIR